MKTTILKIFGLYRLPNLERIEEAKVKVKPLQKTTVDKDYLRKYPHNDLDKINKNYIVV